MNKLEIFKGGFVGLAVLALVLGSIGAPVPADAQVQEATQCKVRANITTAEACGLGVGACPGSNSAIFLNSGATPSLQGNDAGDNAILCGFSLIKWIANVIFGVLIVIAVLMIAYSAFLFVSSGDDQSRRKKAKNVLLWAIVGLIVASVARLIPNIAMSIVVV